MSSWAQFFKDAGIPSAPAKRYAVIFEDNRITTDLLPDLSKDILADMGIKIMGDVICILKHAKKEIRNTECSGNDSALNTTNVNRDQDLVSTTSIPTTTGRRGDVSRVQSKGHVISPQYEEDTGEELREIISPSSLLRSEHDPGLYEESYTTAAYSKKRQGGALYSDEGPSPPKQPRVVVLPGEGGQEMYTATALSRAAAIAAASAAIVATQQQQIPLVTGAIHPEDSTSSVFSRLDHRVIQPDEPERINIGTSTPRAVQPPRMTVDTGKPRTIKLGKESSRVKITAPVPAEKTSRLHSLSQPVNPRKRLGKTTSSEKGVARGAAKPGTMVADEFSFQLKRQQDVRSRLESKEKAKVSRRRGPLAGRLAQHNVFGRLE